MLLLLYGYLKPLEVLMHVLREVSHCFALSLIE